MGYLTHGFVRRMTIILIILGSLVASLYVVFVHAEVQNIAFEFKMPINNDHYGWGYMECNSNESTTSFPDSDGKCNNGGVLHPGIDLNGQGSGNSDRYQLVFATANGTVTYAGNSGNGYGNLVVIKHTLPDGSNVWSVYAHLEDYSVSSTQSVNIGQQIGRVGKSGGQDYAHLHFEIRIVPMSPDQWTNATDTPNSLYGKYVDPLVFINNFNFYTSASRAGYVSLFTDSFFRGGALGYLHPGSYNLDTVGFGNIVSSVGMGGLTATAYDSNTLSGDWLSLYTSDVNLANNGFTDGVSSKGSADNAISSLTVYAGDCSSQLIAASAQAATIGSSCNPNPAPAPGSEPLPPYTGSDTTPPRISAFNVTISGAQAFLSVSASDLGGSGIADISYSAKVNGTWRGVATVTQAPYIFS